MRGTTNIPTVAVIIRQDNKILLFRRRNTGYQDGKYCLPAGHVEAGESFREAGVRELREEVGLEVAVDRLRHIHSLQTFATPDNIRIQLFFEASGWSGQPSNCEPGKHGDIEWLSLDELPAGEMVDFMEVALRAAARGETYSELVYPGYAR